MTRDAEWLVSMLTAELDLRPPRSIEAERVRLESGKPILLRDEAGRLVAHGSLRRLGRGWELVTLVVEPSRRGEGLSHRLVEAAVERVGSTATLHSWTKSPALAKSLLDAGFRRTRWLGLAVGAHLSLLSATRVVAQLLRLEWRRTAHQIINLGRYKLYVLDSKKR
ncbi:MAG: hypothetical protein DSY41_03320 [Candidatus Poseidoniales archaeon]|uniref:GNAT family N-acetyltransferase n=1 Tax=Candidatus Thalassarchaeum betae TaxID=2599289 RepID=UPI0010022F49|nr:GNAT family N-acetyltransferase [Candidatus Thalassoarchaea betae]RTZ94554.1 MAG: hypothetical protein DSY41_03320 [Candidatus Poseidoniales archaeon]RUA28980.1 MAG: hypothetical protein DSY78_13905 [Chloroflexota bacterium]